MGTLNTQQRSAVGHGRGPALVLAGPGTGKTRVLTQRIAYLIAEQKVPASDILAITFTNKAAGEIKKRLAGIFGKTRDSQDSQVYTFHGLGYRILREHADKVARRNDFSIVTEEEKRRYLLELTRAPKAAKEAAERISRIKQTVGDGSGGDAQTRDLLAEYDRMLIENNCFDFDDLLACPLKLFTLYFELLTAYRSRFPWILVDEYQDINAAQFALIRALMPREDSNLFVIGDPNQAIYGFRGSDVGFIDQFLSSYPKAIRYELTTSYRCSNSILKASASILETPASFLSGLQEGITIKLCENASDKSEAEFIARTIEQMIGGVSFFSRDSNVVKDGQNADTKSFSDFSVLCRTKAQMPAIEKALADHGLPCQSITENAFFRQKPFSWCLEALQSLRNPKNRASNDYLLRNKIINEQARELWKGLPAQSTVRQALETIVTRILCPGVVDDPVTLRPLLELAETYGDDFEGFIAFTSLGNGMDTYTAEIQAVSLMTMHAAKGLEFTCVFIAGCEEGLLPYSLFPGQGSDLDEEKRLLYVGMTRAKKYLYLSNARRRFLFGKEHALARSHFLDAIQQELTERIAAEHRKKSPPEKDNKQIELF